MVQPQLRSRRSAAPQTCLKPRSPEALSILPPKFFDHHSPGLTAFTTTLLPLFKPRLQPFQEAYSTGTS